MSQKVLTFNLILSTSKSLVEAALSTKSATKLGEDPRFKNHPNFKFFTLNKNKTLLSFQYTSFKDDPKKLSFILEFLDYDGFFEYHMLSSNINDFIVGYLNRQGNRTNDKGSLNPFNVFYLAFGTDSSFDQWNGPFATFLTQSEYDFTPEGVKRIILTFTNVEGVAASDLAKITHSSNSYKSKFTTTPVHIVLESNHLSSGLRELENKLFDNKVFPKLISDYIKAYTSQESIVLIPDMNQYRDYYESLKNSRSAARGKAKSVPINSELLELEAVDFFGEFGLNLIVSLRNPKAKEVKNSTISDQNNEKEEKRATNNEWQFVLTMRVTTDEAQESRGGKFSDLVDGHIPLQKMGEGLSKLAKPKRTAPYNLFEESDTKILKVWKDLGLIKDDTKPVMVWGRTDYIYNCLYPKLNVVYKNNDLYPELKNKLNSSYISKVKNFYIQTYNSDFNESLGKSLEDFSTNISTFRTVPINEASVKSYNLPVFKSNIKNPNVLEYSFSNNKQNLGLLQMTVQSIIDNAIQDSATFTKADSSTRSKVFDYKGTVVDKYLDPNLGGLYGTDTVNLINNSLPQTTKTKTPELNSLGGSKDVRDLSGKNKSSISNYKQFIEYQKEAKKIKTLQNVVSKFVSNNFENQVQLQQKLNNLMSNQITQIQIKTLPFFSVCGLKYQGFPCIFLQKLFNNFISPMTGVYTIIGIRHVANTEEMYSEFQLSREGVGTNEVVQVPVFRPRNESGDISIDSGVDPTVGDYEVGTSVYEYEYSDVTTEGYTYVTEESYTSTGGDTPVPDPCGEGGG